jgi:hypothetical protein
VTWEWTIGRDFRDRVIGTLQKLLEFTDIISGTDVICTDTAASALHLALQAKHANTDANNDALIYALYLLESAIVLDSDPVHVGRMSAMAAPSTSLLKNTGLAHVHVVQQIKTHTQVDPQTGEAAVGLRLPGVDIFNTSQSIRWPSHDPQLVVVIYILFLFVCSCVIYMFVLLCSGGKNGALNVSWLFGVSSLPVLMPGRTHNTMV